MNKVYKTGQVHILGAGSIGSLFGFHLRKAGVPVTLIFRNKEKSARFKEWGSRVGILDNYGKNQEAGETENIVEFEGGFGVLDAPELGGTASCVSESNRIEKLLVTTKAFDAVAGIARIYPYLSTNPEIMLLLNGMGVLEKVETFFKNEGREKYPRIYVGTTTHGCMPLQQEFSYSHTGFGSCHISEYTTGHPQMELGDSEFVASMISTGLNTGYVPKRTMDTLLLKKLAINAIINPVSALANCKNGLVFAKADSVYPALIPELGAEISRIIKRIPGIETKDEFSAENVIRYAFETSQSTCNNDSSMKVDYDRGNRTEIDYINGYFLKLGEEYGVDAKINRMLCKLIKE
ncbi:putative 2-dehydropantoate 2-reductase [Smittium mucronatum]|uniref:2-dehydropantoate 2-reductase n=1 Tax=Smittium mucronatum TaxID=133383 RepID=A0A1R0H1K0_9FUNG|nr:putative 2-dehydropantoate 2-reductase [Smittium mucronatum]